jgi:hypothetical protein
MFENRRNRVLFRMITIAVLLFAMAGIYAVMASCTGDSLCAYDEQGQAWCVVYPPTPGYYCLFWGEGDQFDCRGMMGQCPPGGN